MSSKVGRLRLPPKSRLNEAPAHQSKFYKVHIHGALLTVHVIRHPA